MSISNDIKNLLDIQDLNLIFEESCVKEGIHKGNTCKFITGKLTYTPSSCEVCGASNQGYTVYKNGTQLSRITLPISGVHPTYLLLHKQRFMCKQCENSFTAKTPIVKKNCHISKNVNAHVVIKSAEAQSITSIARDCSVSPTTVQRMINCAAKRYKPSLNSLPKHLSFDEFKYAKGSMAFQYINAVTGEILDILNQRTGIVIKNHFTTYYNLEVRNSVETVTIDMNAGYATIIKELFPKAEIIIDRFHLVQLINRSMNRCRIRVMNQLNTSNGEDKKKYRRLKKYWKLVLKNESDLSDVIYKHYSLFGQRTDRWVVDEILSYDDELRENHELYQKLLNAMKKRCFETFSKVLTESKSPLICNYMKTSLKTLRTNLPYIKNSFLYPYNNGRIEGINNKIKVLNRVAYGYSNFNNYKNRIMLHFKLKLRVQKRVTSKKQSGPQVA